MKIFAAIIAMVGAAALVYTWLTLHPLWINSRLDKEVPIEHLEIKPVQISPEKFGIEATYRYLGQEGKQLFDDSAYLNPYGAEKGGEKLLKEVNSVWVNSRNPKESALQKSFPYKELAYALLLWGILLYFIFLGWRVGKGAFRR